MSQRNNGKFEQLYNKLTNMPPETLDLWVNAIQRAVDVAEEVDAAAAAEMDKQGNSTECVPNYSDQQLKLSQGLDYSMEILKQMKLTPLPLSKQGGSRKRSINCRRPRGFSQRQHCKYRRRGWKTAATRRVK